MAGRRVGPAEPPRALKSSRLWVDNGATLCVDTRNGAVGVADPHDGPLEMKWPSLAAWVDDVIALWESGVVELSPTGPEVDRSRWPEGVRRDSHW